MFIYFPLDLSSFFLSFHLLLVTTEENASDQYLRYWGNGKLLNSSNNIFESLGRSHVTSMTCWLPIYGSAAEFCRGK